MRVFDSRPAVCSESFSCGVRTLRRTSAVFTRSVSQKASRGPFTAFSIVASCTGRPVWLFVSNVSAAPSPSKMSAAQPAVRSETRSSIVFCRRTVPRQTAPCSMSRAACREEFAAAKRADSVSGRTTSSDTSVSFTSPSIQQTEAKIFFSSPNLISRRKKSSQPKNIFFKFSIEIPQSNSGFLIG